MAEAMANLMQDPRRDLMTRVGYLHPVSFYGSRGWVEGPITQESLQNLSLIIPVFKYPNEAFLFRYFGLLDLDLPSQCKGPWKEWLSHQEEGKVTMDDGRRAFPEFDEMCLRAEELMNTLHQKRFFVVCYFSGGKGMHIYWVDPALLLQINPQEVQIAGRWFVDTWAPLYYHEILGLGHWELGTILDPSIYDKNKGVKPDVHRHPSTQNWPSAPLQLTDGGNLDGSACIRPLEKSYDLERTLVEFWTRIQRLVPDTVCERSLIPTLSKLDHEIHESSPGRSTYRSPRVPGRVPTRVPINNTVLSDEEVELVQFFFLFWWKSVSPHPIAQSNLPYILVQPCSFCSLRLLCVPQFAMGWKDPYCPLGQKDHSRPGKPYFYLSLEKEESIDIVAKCHSSNHSRRNSRYRYLVKRCPTSFQRGLQSLRKRLLNSEQKSPVD